jgi:preprotein translocase subunit YajC
MTESDEPKRRPRWFQFDLRLLFVLIAAVGVILAIEAARRSGKPSRKLLDTLEVGDSVGIRESNERLITIYVGSGGTYRGTITEIGADFIAIKIDGTNFESFFPLGRITSVRRESSSEAAAVKTMPETRLPLPHKTMFKT